MQSLRLHRPDDDERRIHASLPDVRDRAELYSSRVVRGLLACCGLDETGGWILERFSREQIVLVCCYAIHRARLDQTSNAKALALAAFGRRWTVDDRRARVFPQIFGGVPSPRRWTQPTIRPAAVEAPSSPEPEAPSAPVRQVSTPPAAVNKPPMDAAERRTWQQMIADAQGRWASDKAK